LILYTFTLGSSPSNTYTVEVREANNGDLREMKFEKQNISREKAQIRERE
jgi:hypothetical protein